MGPDAEGSAAEGLPAGSPAAVDLIALVPAHNEQDRIVAALAGLYRQERRPDRIIVVADNCTDATAEIARRAGAEVFETSGNRDKKAGALNQALAAVLPGLDDGALVLVQDADTVLDPGFLTCALEALDAPVPEGKQPVGAVGGIFYGEQGGGLLGLLQRMEYQRYAREVDRKGGEAVVLTGTGTVFRSEVLRQVREARLAGRIGGGESYYSLASLTEDDEITKAVKTLGWRTVSPQGCRLVTEVMTSVPKLWHQRLRWQRGALENLRDYGWTPVTAPYFLKQFALGLGCAALLVFLLYFVLFTTLVGVVGFSPLWTSITLLFVVERVVTVRHAGWRAALLAAPLLPELAYDAFRQLVFLRSMADLLLRRAERWEAT